MKHRWVLSLVLAVIYLTGAASLLAQAQRTFVSAASGNDANPCTRALPCRNFAQAISQTAAGGEVIVLDSGGYGTVTIAGPISLISPAGVYAGITAFSGSSITLSAGASDRVVIRGLSLNGQGGTFGIEIVSGGAVQLEDLVVNNFTSYAIRLIPTNAVELYVKDSTLRNSAKGLDVDYGNAGNPVRVVVDHCRIENHAFQGIDVQGNVQAAIRDSIVAGCVIQGILARTQSVMGLASATLVENCLIVHNQAGLQSSGSAALIRVSQTTITANEFGMIQSMGVDLISFGNNRVAGNESDGAFDLIVPLQ